MASADFGLYFLPVPLRKNPSSGEKVRENRCGRRSFCMKVCLPAGSHVHVETARRRKHYHIAFLPRSFMTHKQCATSPVCLPVRGTG